MKNFLQYVTEAVGGQAAGKLELVRTKLDKAREYAQKLLSKKGKDLDEELPDFDKNYKFAQKKASMGKTQRKDMPVIDTSDVKELQKRLSKGLVDVSEPWAPSTKPNDPYPEGLSGPQAKKFLERGLNDGEHKDDIVRVSMKKIAAKDLKPIQKQIYFDKSFGGIADFGLQGTINFLKSKSIFICSSDNFIIDGHHRFLSTILVDPTMKVQCLVIDLPIKKLLPLSLAYGDAIGNKRNA